MHMIGDIYVFLKFILKVTRTECYQAIAKLHFALRYHSFSLFWLSGLGNTKGSFEKKQQFDIQHK